MNKPRTTFEVSSRYDSQFGYTPWFNIDFYNGFILNCGVLGVQIRACLVLKNYW